MNTHGAQYDDQVMREAALRKSGPTIMEDIRSTMLSVGMLGAHPNFARAIKLLSDAQDELRIMFDEPAHKTVRLLDGRVVRAYNVRALLPPLDYDYIEQEMADPAVLELRVGYEIIATRPVATEHGLQQVMGMSFLVDRIQWELYAGGKRHFVEELYDMVLRGFVQAATEVHHKDGVDFAASKNKVLYATRRADKAA